MLAYSDSILVTVVHVPPVLLVNDTVTALQSLGDAYRNVLADAGTKVIAVTGSNGKTTTRNMIHTVLSTRLEGKQSPKSFNNHLGVPLTLLSASPEDDFVVAEIGTNHPGEIAAMARILRPEVAVITNIGLAHLGHFGTIGAIAREKFSLLEYVRPNGVAIIPDNVTIPDSIPAQVAVHLFGHGKSSQTQMTACQSAPKSTGWAMKINHCDGVKLPLPGPHDPFNALAAIAVAHWFGIPHADICHALQHVQDMPGRLQRLQFGQNVIVIHDAYNANPASVNSAISVLVNTPGRRHVAILGDMFELGDQGPHHHRKIGRRLSQDLPTPNMTILIGPLSAHIAETAAERLPHECVQSYSEWTDDLPAQIAARIEPGDVVLLKASRGMALERLLPAIKEKFAKTQ